MVNQTGTRIGGVQIIGGGFSACALVERLSLAVAAVLCLTTGAAFAQNQPSNGVYRIPFENGTQVHVTNDHLKHSPVGRIDMSGREGSGEYKIVAAGDSPHQYIANS